MNIIHNNRLVMLFGVLILAGVFAFIGARPSHNRRWMLDQKILPHISIQGNLVTIQNIRNFSYRTPTDYDVAYYDRTFDLEKIKRVWFVVEPFDKWKGMAHTQLSFEFEGDQFVAVSIETRREVGEEIYSSFKGLFRQYELMYIIADENDAIRLRTNIRHHEVYLYPIDAPREKVRDLFLDMMTKASKIETHPEFYNTLTNNCTSGVAYHVRKIAPHSLPRSLKILLPGYSDRLAYELGLIENDKPFNTVKQKYFITDRAWKIKPGEIFSKVIRGQ